MYYHALDPFLGTALAEIQPGIGVADIASFRRRGPLFDLCFEDTWSGYLIAQHLAGCASGTDLVVMHLDDHADMMPTLLEWPFGEGLGDPTTGTSFNPECPADWVRAISSGVVGIGSFLTPFFFVGRHTHVRHVSDAQRIPAGRYGVARVVQRHEIIARKSFAAIELMDERHVGFGSYAVSPRCEDVLDNLPEGVVVVHIDLDYAINDLNGNARSGECNPSPELIKNGLDKLDRFFKSLTARKVMIDQWIVATSPGFCSGCYWAPLLASIGENIRAYPALSHDTRRRSWRLP